MDSLTQTQRQIRYSLIFLAIIFPVGTLGYMILEDLSMGDAIWLTIITLGTIGYGDLVPTTTAGRVFTIALVFLGIGAVALAAQAGIEFFISPNMRQLRQRRRNEAKIQLLRNHYVIAGEGELVNRTVRYLLRRAEIRRTHQQEALEARVERIFGRAPFRRLALIYYQLRHPSETILYEVVVITQNTEYASEMERNRMLVINDDPSDAVTLRRAGLAHARAMMVMLENDTETLLTVLTARSRNPNVYITATNHADLGIKMTRVGANNVINPYDTAGQFLNNATLPPAVNAFFSSIMFEQRASEQIVQIYLDDQSPWNGVTLGSLQLRDRFGTGIIGIRHADGTYVYTPDDSYVLSEDEVLLAITPGASIPALKRECCASRTSTPAAPNWQRLPLAHTPRIGSEQYSLASSEETIQQMQRHYLICGSGQVLDSALKHLNPDQPFVVVSDDSALIQRMLERGFRVVQGSLEEDDTFKRAGINRALAMMVAVDNRAEGVLAVLNGRTLNRDILIVATANEDEMVPKLRRAGADRVVSPFRIAAQLVLLATTQPAVSDFLQYVLYNHDAGIETTELYMQDNTPWIGKSLGELHLDQDYHAAVVGIRIDEGRFIYAPPPTHQIAIGQVLIVIMPMDRSDDLRLVAHGGQSRRPRTLRRDVNRLTGIWRGNV
jgi:voltage-gated potassium channel